MRAVRLRRRRLRLPVRPRRRHTKAQALVEFALAAPFVLLLVVGAGQLGAVAYGMVSTDTAAREGARYGATHPLSSLQAGSWGGNSYQCQWAVDNPSVAGGNPICQAVYRSAGLLDATKLQITITTNVSMFSGALPSDVVRLGNPNPTPSATPLPCGADAEVDGSVALSDGSAPTQPIQVTANGQGTVPAATVQPGSTTFRLCLAVNSHNQTINAVMGSTGCGGWSGQASVNVTQNNQTYTPSPNPLVLSPNVCPTPTPTPSPTPSPSATTSPTASPTASGSFTPVPTDTPPPPFTCDNSAASSTQYFTVTVDYPVTIFVPLIGAMVGDSGNSTQRTVHETVTARVEPCSITGNQ